MSTPATDATSPILAKIGELASKGMTGAIEVTARPTLFADRGRPGPPRRVTIWMKRAETRRGQSVIYAIHSTDYVPPVRQWAERALGRALPADLHGEPDQEAFIAGGGQEIQGGGTVKDWQVDAARRDWAYGALAAALTWRRPSIKVRKRLTTEAQKFNGSEWQRINADLTARVDAYERGWGLICQGLAAANLPVGSAGEVAPYLAVLIPGDPDFHDLVPLDELAARQGRTRADMVKELAQRIAAGELVTFERAPTTDPSALLVPERLEDAEHAFAPAVGADAHTDVQRHTDVSALIPVDVPAAMSPAGSGGYADADDVADRQAYPPAFVVPPPRPSSLMEELVALTHEDDPQPPSVGDELPPLAPLVPTPTTLGAPGELADGREWMGLGDHRTEQPAWPPLPGLSAAAVGSKDADVPVALPDLGDLVLGADDSASQMAPPEGYPLLPDLPTAEHQPLALYPEPAASPEQAVPSEPAPVEQVAPVVELHPTEPRHPAPAERRAVTALGTAIETLLGGVSPAVALAILQQMQATTISQVAALSTNREQAAAEVALASDDLAAAQAARDDAITTLRFVERQAEQTSAAHRRATEAHEAKQAAVDVVRAEHDQVVRTLEAHQRELNELLDRLAATQAAIDAAQRDVEAASRRVSEQDAELASTTWPAVQEAERALEQFERETLTPARDASSAAAAAVEAAGRRRRLAQEAVEELTEQVAATKATLEFTRQVLEVVDVA